MWTTLVVLASLAAPVAADAASLKLTNVHLTNGKFGPPRGNADLLPGANLDIGYTIEGLTVTASGEVEYSADLEIFKGGKSLFKQEGKPLRTILALGGNQLPANAHLELKIDQAPGEYSARVTIHDVPSKQSQSFTQRVNVLPPEFGIFRITTTSDPDGNNPTAVPGCGEALWINFVVVSFGREAGKEKKPNLAIEMQIFDKDGKPTTVKPFTGTVTQMVPEQVTAIPAQFLIGLNRPGTYKVVLKATCQVCKKTAEREFPLVVVAPQ
jgi:hypothetical protein